MIRTTISVLTPSIREGSLDIVEKGLLRQTIDYDEWILGTPFDPKVGTWVKDDFEGGFYSLNRIGNKMVKRATGDLIVSIQDFTFFNPEALEKFVYWHEKYPNAIISGIGDKYASVYPTLGEKLWVDPRRQTGKGVWACPFHYIESNFCAFPRQAIIDMGGYDENLDFLGFGLDSYALLDRMNITGKYKFLLDDSNESFSLTHGRHEDWDRKGISADMYKELHAQYEKNPVLSFI